MTERQSPRETAMVAIDACSRVLVEELESLEQLASGRPNHAFDVGRARTVWNEQCQVDLRRRHARERAIWRYRGCRRTSPFYIRVPSALGERRRVDISENQLDSEGWRRPYRSIQFRAHDVADSLSVDV